MINFLLKSVITKKLKSKPLKVSYYICTLPMRTNLTLKLIERTYGSSRSVLEADLTVPTLVKLPELVDGNPDGERWLRRLRAETGVENYPESETIELYKGMLEPDLEYVLTPRDGCEGEVYKRPRGHIDVPGLNGEVAILDVPEGQEMERVRFLRRGASGGVGIFDSYGGIFDSYGGIFDSYGLVPSADTEDTPSYLVGRLEAGNFTQFVDASTRTFPIGNYLEVVYPCGDDGYREMVVRLE